VKREKKNYEMGFEIIGCRENRENKNKKNTNILIFLYFIFSLFSLSIVFEK
tara:strand:+ start:314 stop:466 length:153 start_codon:yes stop_codon:yes gene_type:complete